MLKGWSFTHMHASEHMHTPFVYVLPFLIQVLDTSVGLPTCSGSCGCRDQELELARMLRTEEST